MPFDTTLDQVIADLDPKALDAAVLGVLLPGGARIQRQLETVTPVGETGNLRRGYRTEQSGPAEVSVVNRQSYIRFVDIDLSGADRIAASLAPQVLDAAVEAIGGPRA